MILITFKGYCEEADKQSKRRQLNDQQQKQIKQQWITKNGSKVFHGLSNEEIEKQAETHVTDIQNAEGEISEMLESLRDIDLTNPIVSCKLTRYGNLHVAKAKTYSAKLKAEIKKTKKVANDCKVKGLKNISKAIGDRPAKPLTCVCRDRDTQDGGKAGEITTCPQEADAVVRRAWK